MDLEPVIAILGIFVALPWLILHYVTKWKTAPKLSDGDEQMLEELYQLARRLDSRMDTVERLVASDNPDFQRPRLIADNADDDAKLDEIERMIKERTAR